ncbi:MAG: hypothetical protein FWD58_02070 [Firmicutes bacterium]|nr:hypothetical protein [Bacillota bacterium]
MDSSEKCPICGQENNGLHIEETNGWFTCCRCGKEVNNYIDIFFKQMTTLPAYTLEQIVKLFGRVNQRSAEEGIAS